jgi:hypothetical protein
MPQPPTQNRTKPRPGLAQLLIWIACFAVCLAVLRALAREQPKPLGVLAVLGYAVCVATAWAGGVVLMLRAASGARWPLEPGHWLLAVLGADLIVEILLQITPPTVFARPGLAHNALVCWLYVLPLFSRHLQPRWKAFFLLMVFLYGGPLLLAALAVLGAPMSALAGKIATVLSRASTPVAAGSVLTTALLDYRRGQDRDWMHWCGIAVFVGIMGLRWAIVLRS